MRLALALVLLASSAARADSWDVRVPDEVTVAPGVPATVSLSVAPGGGRTISTDGPVRISLDSKSLTVPRQRYGRKQAADPGADALRFEMALQVGGAPTAGDHELTVDVRAWLCTGKTCRPMHTTRVVIVHGVAPAPPEPSSP